jgi:hypothetical protein
MAGRAAGVVSGRGEWSQAMTNPDAGNCLSNNHWTVRSYRQRVETKQLRALILEGHDTICRNGQLCEMKKKALGFGIYDIWYEEKP